MHLADYAAIVMWLGIAAWVGYGSRRFVMGLPDEWRQRRAAKRQDTMVRAGDPATLERLSTAVRELKEAGILDEDGRGYGGHHGLQPAWKREALATWEAGRASDE